MQQKNVELLAVELKTMFFLGMLFLKSFISHDIPLKGPSHQIRNA
jgi:hypothetical protein